MPFRVCEFDDGMLVVPRTWINEDYGTAQYPPQSWGQRAKMAVRQEVNAKPNWPIYKIQGYVGGVFRKFSFLKDNTTLLPSCKVSPFFQSHSIGLKLRWGISQIQI